MDATRFAQRIVTDRLLLHQRSPVRWLAVIYALGFVVSAVSPPGSPIGPVALVAVTVAAVGMARQVRTR